MKTVLLDLPTFGFIVSTRAALGVGIGLLVSERLSRDHDDGIGATPHGHWRGHGPSALSAHEKRAENEAERDGLARPNAIDSSSAQPVSLARATTMTWRSGLTVDLLESQFSERAGVIGHPGPT